MNVNKEGMSKYDYVVEGGNKGDKSKTKKGQKDYEGMAAYDEKAMSAYEKGMAMAEKGVKDADTEDMPIVDREKDAMTKGDMGASMYDMNKAPSMRGMKISYGPVSGMNMSNYKKGNGKPAGPAMMGHPSFIKGGKVKK